MRTPPDEHPDVRTRSESHSNLHVASSQFPNDSVQRSEAVKLIEYEPNDRLHLLVGVDHDVAGRSAQIARGHWLG